MKKLSVFFLAGLMLFLGACVKQDFDKPPINELPVGTVYTISQLRQMYADSGAYQFNTDASVYGVVTMDESSGNIYKSAYIQDATDAVNLHFLQPGGVRVGDSIRVYLKGVILSDYHGMFQLDNVNNDSSIVILANQKYVQPQSVSISDLVAGNYVGRLISLDGVQFSQSELGKTWAEEGSSANRQLEDCNDNQIIVRTSSYATFADQPLPEGNGDLIAIAGVYDQTPQLYIRSLSEVNLTGERCQGGGGGGGTTINPVDEVNETFESAENNTDIAIEGWSNIIVAGDRTWQGKVYNNDKYAQATGYNSGLDDMECWLITPPVKNQNGDKKLTFKSAMAYWTHQAGNQPLTVLASTDFDGSNFETATWTELSPTLPDANGANYSWVESGEVSLADFVGNVAVAFKYKGSNTESTSIQLDDVVISANGGGGGGGGSQGVTSLDEDFSSLAQYDPVSNIPGWGSFVITGTREWIAKVYSDNVYVQATSYNSNEENVMWMTTPAIDLDAMNNPKFSFDNAVAYWTHDGLEVFISTDFDGSNIESATWTKLDCNLAGENTANHEWVSSGVIDLSGFSGTAYIGFKYSGDANAGLTASYRIDNVKLWDE